jgi:hypothetical protein
MKRKYLVCCSALAIILQSLCGCVGVPIGDSLERHLGRLEQKIPDISIDPMGPITYDDAAALLLDYYRRFGPLEELDRRDVLEQVARKTSRPHFLHYDIVVQRLNELSKGAIPDGVGYGSFMEAYNHAAADGPQQAKEFLSKHGIWIDL